MSTPQHYITAYIYEHFFTIQAHVVHMYNIVQTQTYNMCVYIYTCNYVYMYIYIYVYTHIQEAYTRISFPTTHPKPSTHGQGSPPGSFQEEGDL